MHYGQCLDCETVIADEVIDVCYRCCSVNVVGLLEDLVTELLEWFENRQT